MLVPIVAEHMPELRRILATPQVRLRWRDEDASLQWPFDDPTATRFAVLIDGVVRGMVQCNEEDAAAYRHAWIDIFLHPWRARAWCRPRSRDDPSSVPGP